MPYATTTDAIALYGVAYVLGSADRDADMRIDSASVDLALTHADSLIDKYLSERYTVPLASVPPWVQAASIDVAIYKLSATHDVLTDEKRKRYDDAITCLREVAAGGSNIDTVEDTTPIVVDAETPTLTREALCDLF